MSENNPRKLLKPTDIIIILVLLILSLGIFLFINNSNKEDTIAQITYNGHVVKEINLSNAQNGTFTLEEKPNVHFEIKDGKIRFMDTECPDKLCENVGFISTTNSVAICMPNKVTLKIISKDTQIDTIVN